MTKQHPFLGYRNVLVWVGCVELAERACELASAIAHPSLPVTLGIPAGESGRMGLDKLVRALVEREADVRIVALDDRGSSTLARRAREGAHDLVIHADRDGATTPSRERLERLCACRVWTVRGAPRRPRHPVTRSRQGPADACHSTRASSMRSRAYSA